MPPIRRSRGPGATIRAVPQAARTASAEGAVRPDWLRLFIRRRRWSSGAPGGRPVEGVGDGRFDEGPAGTGKRLEEAGVEKSPRLVVEDAVAAGVLLVVYGMAEVVRTVRIDGLVVELGLPRP